MGSGVASWRPIRGHRDALHRARGVEAARESIVREIVGVFGVYGIDVNPRHLSLIADSATQIF